jgi:hypothetical protein
VNSDTVIAMTSLKPKNLWIYDTLISTKNGLIVESNIGGNIIVPWRNKQTLLTFNEKPGLMHIFDLRTNKVLHSTSIFNEEITSVTMNAA